MTDPCNLQLQAASRALRKAARLASDRDTADELRDVLGLVEKLKQRMERTPDAMRIEKEKHNERHQ